MNQPNTHQTTTASTHAPSNSAQENLHLYRGEKEFTHDEKTLQKKETKLQQRGGEGQRPHRFRPFAKREKGEPEHQSKEKEPGQRTEEQIERNKKERPRENEKQILKEKRKANEKKLARQELKEQSALQHDMRDAALGQMYKVPGANIDYDEAKRMAENHIRDAGELVSESMQNDGMQDVSRMEQVMAGFLKDGSPSPREIQQMAKETEPEVVAMAYTNVAKNAGRRDLMRLTVLDEKLDFEQPKYERVFDRIRARDAEADRVLDKLDMEMGRERE